jgi:predicted RND superfamily exporter protein
MDAVKEAGMSRFRAIFLTTVTTTAGLMPLILENSPDARMLIPMAISLAYGILFGTLFILIILPVLVVMVNAVSRKVRGFNSEFPLSPEEVEPAVKYAAIDKTLSVNMAKEFD